MHGSGRAVYAPRVMNDSSSPDTSTSTALTGSDAISRRAYEIWEREGRPEGNDMRHWLQAEQELAGMRQDNGVRSTGANTTSDAAPARPPQSDVTPLQGTRAAAAASREPKRSAPPTSYGSEKSTPSNSNGQAAGRRKSSSAPVM